MKQHKCGPGILPEKIWYDSIAYEPHALHQLIDQAGIEQVVIGTDYPFDMGAYDVHTLVDAIPALTETERE